MANKALGRDLGDLLSRAQPARIVGRAARSTPPPVEAGPGERRSDPAGPAPAPGAAGGPGAAAVATTPSDLPMARPPARGMAPPMGWWSARLGWLLAADFVLLLLAATLVFTDLANRSWARPMALAAVVAGGILGLLGLRGPVGNQPAPPPPSAPPGNPRIRVQLKR